ncbi:hypothetical protein ACFOKF_12075 [Sphingobium rhizovicinum]|uniref:Tetratricopeptide repeat protein n=1 Tax=Sphingobium rhizovicinum TaxID=432308 RepID=A0ABV7NHM2_9SPHN
MELTETDVQMVYANDDVEVKFLDQGGSRLLMTFAPLNYNETMDLFWGHRFARKAGLSAIGFVAKKPNWYPGIYVRPAIEAIAALLARFPDRIAYGSSMGGYGALKYSSALGATATLAFGPQTSINPADGITQPGFTRHFIAGLHDDMAVDGADVAANSYLFYDPRERFDLANAGMIGQAAPAIHQVRIPFAGHECVKIIAGSEPALRLIDLCARGDLQGVNRAVRALRAPSGVRATGIARALLARHPDCAIRIGGQFKDRFDRKSRALFEHDIAKMHLANGEALLAMRHVQIARRIMPRYMLFIKTHGAILEALERWGSAHRVYSESLAIDDADAVTHCVLARIEVELGRWEQALESCRKALAILPDHPRILRRVAAIHQACGAMAAAHYNNLARKAEARAASVT